MILTNTLASDDYSRKSGKPDFLSFLHWIACIFCTLLTVYCLFYCYLSFTGALQDMRKYGGLGFSYPFQYYLKKNNFSENVNPFLCVTAEFLLYIAQYRRAERKKPFRGSIWYFSVMLVIHAVVWLHANSLSLPDGPPFSSADLPGVRYRRFANMTILPSVIYFILYSLRSRKLRSEK